MSDSRKSGGGLGLLDVILVVNIILKLVGVISWSWGVVLWPLWVTLGLLGILLIALLIANS
jgi:hypothetical protein